MDNSKTITISLEEYKSLLIIKGKYEELKGNQMNQTYPKITYRSYSNEGNKDDQEYSVGYTSNVDSPEYSLWKNT